MSRSPRDWQGIAAVGMVTVAGVAALGLIVIAVIAVRLDSSVAVEATAALVGLGTLAGGAVATFLGLALGAVYRSYREPAEKEETHDQ